MAVNQKDNELHVYSINENEFVGAINSPFNSIWTSQSVVVLDYSSAMGDVAERLVKEVLPLVMEKVKNWGTCVQFFTFGEESVHKYLSSIELSKFDLKSGGAANIAPAIEKLRLFFERQSNDSRYPFNILTISAAQINDRENAEQETKKLTDVLAGKNGWRINSQAVRLFTTSNDHQPDTKALSYLLQINNSTEANICDINVSSSNETIANEIAALFPENVTTWAFLYVDKPMFSRFPWESSEYKYFILSSGWNIFWLKQLSKTDVVKLIQSGPNNKVINVVVEGQLTLAKFQQLMEQMLPQIVSHLKILKIAGTAEANESVDRIFSYFAQTEEAVAVKCSTPNNKIITNALAGMAMYRPDFRDSAEMMEFHRNPTKAIEDQIERDRLKKEEEQKQEQAERLKKEEVERLKKEEAERLKQEEEATAARKRQSNSIQTVFILDEHSPSAIENRSFMEDVIPLTLSKCFRKSVQLVHQVTFVRYTSNTAEMHQLLVQTLDATKRIRISVLTSGGVHEPQEIENFAETLEEFLNGAGYAFDLEVVKVNHPPPTTKRYKVLDFNANESNEFIAKQIASMSLQ